jgi:glycosyltransferase involved in cell wall biosynthesis
MKLLITTQIVDSQDSNLGFFHRWIEEFAKHCEKVTVICLKEGDHVLPPNVTVLSLGKEQGTNRLTRVWRFLNYIHAYRSEYDAVLVHMNPEYVLLGGYLWHRWGKKVGLWYAHGSVTRMLKRAVRIVDRVFTSSHSGFRLQSPKVSVVGQGIDTELFNPAIHLESTSTRFLTAGRIAESKHLIETLQMLDTLHAKGEKFTFTIVGEPTNVQEQEYAQKLHDEVMRRPFANAVTFTGAIPHHELPNIFHAHDLFLNFSTTGSLDKAVLEALASGIPAFTANPAFRDLLEPYDLFSPTIAGETAAEALQKFLNRGDRPAVVATLRNKVVAEHSLSSLIPKILRDL